MQNQLTRLKTALALGCIAVLKAQRELISGSKDYGKPTPDNEDIFRGNSSS